MLSGFSSYSAEHLSATLPKMPSAFNINVSAATLLNIYLQLRAGSVSPFILSGFSSYSAEHLSATEDVRGCLLKSSVSAATLLNIYLQRKPGALTPGHLKFQQLLC